jgi:hypothetical protein
MMNPAKEILDAIQNEADFENTDVEKKIINVLELLNKDLIYVQYEPSSEIEAAVLDMNKEIAKANSDIEADEDDEEEDDEEGLEHLFDEDEPEEDEEDELELHNEVEPETADDPTTNEESTPA